MQSGENTVLTPVLFHREFILSLQCVFVASISGSSLLLRPGAACCAHVSEDVFTNNTGGRMCYMVLLSLLPCRQTVRKNKIAFTKSLSEANGNTCVKVTS